MSLENTIDSLLRDTAVMGAGDVPDQFVWCQIWLFQRHIEDQFPHRVGYSMSVLPDKRLLFFRPSGPRWAEVGYQR